MPVDLAFAADAAGRVGDAMGRTQPDWLVVAVMLHVAGQVSRGVAWYEVLRVLWPGISRARVCAWHVCGAGLTGVLSTRGGDAVRIALAKRDLPDAKCATLAGTLVAEGSLATVFGIVVTLIAVAAGAGTVAAPPAELLLAAAVGLAGVWLLTRRSRRVGAALREVMRGASVLRDPGLFARRVLPWQLANRILRLCSVWCLLHAVGLPTGIAVVLAVCAAQGSGSAVPLPAANVAAATAALLVALPLVADGPVDTAAVAALAVVAAVTLTVVGVALSFVLGWVLLGNPLSAERPFSTLRATALAAPGDPQLVTGSGRNAG